MENRFKVGDWIFIKDKCIDVDSPDLSVEVEITSPLAQIVSIDDCWVNIKRLNSNRLAGFHLASERADQALCIGDKDSNIETLKVLYG